MLVYYKDIAANVVIPNAIDVYESGSTVSKQVVGLSGTFTNNEMVTEIEVDSAIKFISYGTFRGCNSLSKLTIPYVGLRKDAQGEQGLLGYMFEFDISGNTEHIYSQPDTIPIKKQKANIPSSLTEVTITNCDYLAIGAFSGIASLQKINIIGDTTSIPSRCFQNCIGLTNVVLPSNSDSKIETIGHSAFKGCTVLSNLTIPTSVIDIQTNAFTGCSISNIFIPISVISMGKNILTETKLTNTIVEIRCAALEKPEGWDPAFNTSCTVKYGESS